MKDDSDEPINIPGNLIKSGIQYIHSQLREPVPPPRCYQDENGDTVWENIDEPFVPKIKRIYMLEDLSNITMISLRSNRYFKMKIGIRAHLT